MGKTYTYYPGCSSEGSAKHLDQSLRATLSQLDAELEMIPDWNCCGASVGHIEGGLLPTAALSGRNLAQAQQMDAQRDVLTPCAACYLNTHYYNEKIRGDEGFKDDVNAALGADEMAYDAGLHVRHACEVLVNDIGYDAIRAKVVNPLAGLKVAPYVGCQTVRPFANTDRGGAYDTYDEPTFLDEFIEACGAESLEFDAKTKCCGGSSSVMNPEKTLHLMKRIVEEAADKGADVIATPCPLCQTNVEMYQAEINKKYGTDYNIPVVFYSQLMAVAFGMDPDKDAALNVNTIDASVVAEKART